VRRPALLLGAVVLAGCTAAPAPEPTAAAPVPEPVVPPAACVLDVAVLSSATGLTWAADETTASDTRCVYDPAPGSGTDFVAVDVLSSPPTGSGPPPAALDTLARACAADTRAPAGTDGFVCRFPGGGVFAARDRAGVVVTVAAAEVPAATTADQLAAAFTEQLASAG
jgi:hypothetical protein